jgi:2'-5' RNA ligase
MDPFHIKLRGITPSTLFGNYLFLNIIEGSNQIVELHKRLYSYILKGFYPKWLSGRDYLPHMTVGNINDLETFYKAVEETKNIDDVFQTTVEMISVEIIDENEDSTIEIEVSLRKGD